MIKFNNETIKNAIMDALDKMERGIEISEVDRNELINVILKYGDRDFGIDTANRKYTEEELQYSVYIHINGSNSKCYIGRTSMKPKDRWGSNGLGYRRQYFHENIKKYKWKNFSHIVLCYGLTKEEGDRFEINLISILKSNNKDFGYNIANGGNCVGMFSQETLNKMSNNRKGIKFSEEHKKKIGEAHKGEKHHMYGKHLSDETRKKLSEANKGRFVGEKSPLYRIPRSEEDKKKISEANRGGKNPRAKKVYCDGMIFDCVKQCAKFYNVVRETMNWWLNKNKIPTKFQELGLRYATDEDIKNFPFYEEEPLQ